MPLAALFLYSLKNIKNLWFPVFNGHGKRPKAWVTHDLLTKLVNCSSRSDPEKVLVMQ